MSSQVAGGLFAMGIRPGDHVALMCPNLPYFAMAYFGILKVGAVVVPLNVLLRPREIAYHLRDSDCKAILCFEGTSELPMAQMAKAGIDVVTSCEDLIVMTSDPTATKSPIDGARTLAQLMHRQPTEFETHAVAADDTAVMLYTSGTTGQAKGAELTHLNMTVNAMVVRELTLPVIGGDVENITAVTLPLFHSFGQTAQMNAVLYAGGTLVLLPRFDPATLIAAIKRERITHWAGVPTMYWGLLGAREEEQRRRVGHQRIPAIGDLGRQPDAGRADASVRADIQCPHHRRLRSVRNGAGCDIQSSRTTDQAGDGRAAGLRSTRYGAWTTTTSRCPLARQGRS